jgi:ABC-type Fe3+/spermidine/putrescine transport system ATPase subunit
MKGGDFLDNTINLVKKAIRGNDKAFEKLVKQESEKLYKTAFLYVRNKEDALDVLQEAIYKTYVSIDQVKQPADIWKSKDRPFVDLFSSHNHLMLTRTFHFLFF